MEVGVDKLDALRELHAFLNGEAPLHGTWFDDEAARRYWWRVHLNRIDEAADEITRLNAENAEALDELARIIGLNDECGMKYGGLADCIDNSGQPYQSQALANCLARARAILRAQPRPAP
jgi:hypothetical protein